jgi:hypothetical protein
MNLASETEIRGLQVCTCLSRALSCSLQLVLSPRCVRCVGYASVWSRASKPALESVPASTPIVNSSPLVLQLVHFLHARSEVERWVARFCSRLVAQSPDGEAAGELLQQQSNDLVNACVAAHPVLRSPRPLSAKVALLPRAMHLAAAHSCATERGEWIIDASDAALEARCRAAA